ncbi:MAG: phospholipase D-like domain-containing protein [Verrucomicrobiota bacterium]
MLENLLLIIDKFYLVGVALIPFLHFLTAGAVTWHAILHKRESRTVTTWVALAWLAPFMGAFFYLILGINRIERKGAELDIKSRGDVGCGAPSESDLEGAEVMFHDHRGFLGLARAGRAITGREICFGNAISPLIDGDEAYPEMLEAISKAQHSVTLLSYIFDNDRVGDLFFEELLKAHERGIEVRVLVDYVGSRYGPRPTIVKRMGRAGIPVAAFLEPGGAVLIRYANLRNHRKILVVDGEVGFTGGTNIREGHWLSMDPKEPVECLHFKIEGPVVEQMQEAFATDWRFTTGEILSGAPWFQNPKKKGSVAARGVTDGPDEDLDKMKEMLSSAVSIAEESVLIVTPYFLPDDSLLEALVTASLRGVEIDVLLPGKNNIRVMDWATEPQMPSLIEKGCRLYRSPEPFDHTKVMIVDGAWSLIGSTNWDSRSLRLNFEYNLECYGSDFARSLERVVREKIDASDPVTLEVLRSRNQFIRLRNGVARLFSPYL